MIISAERGREACGRVPPFIRQVFVGFTTYFQPYTYTALIHRVLRGARRPSRISARYDARREISCTSRALGWSARCCALPCSSILAALGSDIACSILPHNVWTSSAILTRRLAINLRVRRLSPPPVLQRPQRPSPHRHEKLSRRQKFCGIATATWTQTLTRRA